MAEEVLTLSTLRARRKVVVNGGSFEMIDLDELPLAEGLGMKDLADAFEKVGKGSEVDMAALQSRLDRVAHRILPGLPGDLHAALTDMQRLRLLTAFLEKPAPAPEAKPEASRGPC
jgi:hypothetical protein